MAEIVDRELLDQEDRLFEEDFLLAAQCEIQRLLTDRQLRYRDLSKRLGVSEARVSQMLGDQAANLTIRTIARIFRRLGEAPVLMTKREYDRLAAGRERPDAAPSEAWTMIAADVGRFAVACVQVVDVGESVGPGDGRRARSSEWLQAEPLLACRAG